MIFANAKSKSITKTTSNATHIVPDGVAFVPPLWPVVVANPLQILGTDFTVVSHVVPTHPLGWHFRGWAVGQYAGGGILSGPKIFPGWPVMVSPNISNNCTHLDFGASLLMKAISCHFNPREREKKNHISRCWFLSNATSAKRKDKKGQTMSVTMWIFWCYGLVLTQRRAFLEYILIR